MAYRANLSPVSVVASLTFVWVDLEESGVMPSLSSVDVVLVCACLLVEESKERHTVREILAAGVRHVDCWLVEKVV